MKITDSPGAMLVMPFSVTAAAGDSELSSTFQPVMSTALAPVLVTSNQSAPTGLLPLDHGATSVTRRSAGAGGLAIRPGEPTSAGSPSATKAPFTPATLIGDRDVVQSRSVVECAERRARATRRS